MGIHSNSFLLYCVILWLSIKVVHIYTHLLKVIAERHLKKVSPSVFQTVARRSLRGFWKSLKGLSVYSSMGKAGYSDLLIMMQNHLGSIIFEADTVLWHGCTKWSWKIIQLQVPTINKVCMATLDLYSTKPLPLLWGFSFSILFTYLLSEFLCIFIAFTQKNY